MTLTPESPLSDVLANRAARAMIQNYLPGILNSPMLHQLKGLPVGVVIGLNAELSSRTDELENLWKRLAAVPEAASGQSPPSVREKPRADYEPGSAATGSASFRHAGGAACWDMFEVVIDGPEHGNPFTEVELTAAFVHTDSAGAASSRDVAARQVGGFYDGDGLYKVRFMPDKPGGWTFRTSSNARSLDGLEGRFHCSAPNPGNHGPVRVADQFHFAHADGRRYRPIGTTAYGALLIDS